MAAWPDGSRLLNHILHTMPDLPVDRAGVDAAFTLIGVFEAMECDTLDWLVGQGHEAFDLAYDIAHPQPEAPESPLGRPDAPAPDPPP